MRIEERDDGTLSANGGSELWGAPWPLTLKHQGITYVFVDCEAADLPGEALFKAIYKPAVPVSTSTEYTTASDVVDNAVPAISEAGRLQPAT